MSSSCPIGDLGVLYAPSKLSRHHTAAYLYVWFHRGIASLVVVNIYVVKEKQAGAVAEFHN